jgi:hypothetical protein
MHKNPVMPRKSGHLVVTVSINIERTRSLLQVTTVVFNVAVE